MDVCCVNTIHNTQSPVEDQILSIFVNEVSVTVSPSKKINPCKKLNDVLLDPIIL